MNSKDFVPHNIALEMKSLGFNEPCFGRWLIITEWGTPTGEIRLQIGAKAEDYDKEQFHAPTFSQCFRWFRERRDLQYWLSDGGYLGKCFIKITGYKHDKFYFSSSEPMEYEEAELACLIKLIEIVK